jgi:ribosome-binding ATPase YchF (GTP1/OBG family)
MDAETLRVVQRAIEEGVASTAWPLFIVAVLSAGLGAFFGSYLRRKGEDAATRENFEEVLKQLRAQTKATEEIKQEFQSMQEQQAFLRDLYASAIREYSSKQAHALRQAYLMVFEPFSASVNTSERDFEERVAMAVQFVMQPLREHLGILDKATIGKIYSVQNELLDMKGEPAEERLNRKINFFAKTDSAVEYVKADQIAFRLGLIKKPLESKAEITHD